MRDGRADEQYNKKSREVFHGRDFDDGGWKERRKAKGERWKAEEGKADIRADVRLPCVFK
jgi:hypothetical protein